MRECNRPSPIPAAWPVVFPGPASKPRRLCGPASTTERSALVPLRGLPLAAHSGLQMIRRTLGLSNPKHAKTSLNLLNTARLLRRNSSELFIRRNASCRRPRRLSRRSLLWRLRRGLIHLPPLIRERHRKFSGRQGCPRGPRMPVNDIPKSLGRSFGDLFRS